MMEEKQPISQKGLIDGVILKKKLSSLDSYQGIERLWQCLPAARLVGGSVRDLILGHEIHDIDLAVPIPPQQVMSLLEKEQIRVFPTGLEHGTVTAVIDGHHYEITTLRCDLQTDGRHAKVAWTDDWREDAARRDFTINALSLDKEGNLYDYFSGIEDLKNNIVRFVGEACQRIEEDALRILRFFRFSARYSDWTSLKPLEQNAYEAIKEKKNLIGNLSAERIASELLKILAGPHLLSLISSMEKMGIWEEIFPSITKERLENLLHVGHVISNENEGLKTGKKQEPLIENGVILRLYTLISHADYAKKLKLSNVIMAHLRGLEEGLPFVSYDISDDAMRRLLVCYHRSILRDKSWLVQADNFSENQLENAEKWTQYRKKIASMEQPIFPLLGKDLLSLGIEPGPEMGKLLKKVQSWWMREGCLPDREACMKWLYHMRVSS